jgi:hypothetical protein
MEDVGIFYGDLVYFSRFGTFSPVLVCCTKTNLVTRLGMGNAGILNGHLLYFTDICIQIVWYCGIWYIFPIW